MKPGIELARFDLDEEEMPSDAKPSSDTRTDPDSQSEQDGSPAIDSNSAKSTVTGAEEHVEESGTTIDDQEISRGDDSERKWIIGIGVAVVGVVVTIALWFLTPWLQEKWSSEQRSKARPRVYVKELHVFTLVPNDMLKRHRMRFQVGVVIDVLNESTKYGLTITGMVYRGPVILRARYPKLKIDMPILSRRRLRAVGTYHLKAEQQSIVPFEIAESHYYQGRGPGPGLIHMPGTFYLITKSGAVELSPVRVEHKLMTRREWDRKKSNLDSQYKAQFSK